METFYTIIKIAPNTIAGDSLSIGLLLSDGYRFLLQFSPERKALAKQLLNTQGGIVDFVIKQIQQKIDEVNEDLSNEHYKLFSLPNLLTSDRFNYLNTYSNGLIRFTEPSFLNDEVSNEKFIKLFKLLIDKNFQEEKSQVDPKEIELRKTVEDKLISRVHNKVHTNFEVTPNKLPGLYFNFNVDCLGLNGALIGAKSVPFFKNYQTIDKQLSHYLSLISILRSSYSTKKGEDKFYIIGNEPSETNSREHRIWETIKSNPAFTLIHAEQSGIIAEEIEEKNAAQFL